MAALPGDRTGLGCGVAACDAPGMAARPAAGWAGAWLAAGWAGAWLAAGWAGAWLPAPCFPAGTGPVLPAARLAVPETSPLLTDPAMPWPPRGSGYSLPFPQSFCTQSPPIA